jgi:hypothetical protein
VTAQADGALHELHRLEDAALDLRPAEPAALVVPALAVLQQEMLLVRGGLCRVGQPERRLGEGDEVPPAVRRSRVNKSVGRRAGGRRAGGWAGGRAGEQAGGGRGLASQVLRVCMDGSDL